jgi:protein-L-isoaspartate(D-aspartate) O-methyltransferase
VDFDKQRARMVERQLRRRGISDERVLDAMGRVPRELFVPEANRAHSYRDGALTIGHDQTISQPWIVAAIAQALALTGSEAVLEIGTGSGYSTAVLARLAAEVMSVELVPELAERASDALAALGVRNVTVVEADGSAGVEGMGTFGGIAVHATAPAPPDGLLAQLAPGAHMVVPIALDDVDMLTVFRRPEDGGEIERKALAPARFVPLLGDQGF